MKRYFLLICLIVIGISPNVMAENLRIMACNLTSGNGQSYEGPGIRIMQGLEPDIVLIQEFSNDSGSLRDLVDEALGSSYEYMVEPGGESIPNGIISKYPILSSGEWNDSQVSDRDFAWAIIDIPGEINLQAVSIHLKAGSGSDDSSKRISQSNALSSLIASNFDTDHYIVVGGDCNFQSFSEQALNIMNTFLAATDHQPADQSGNRNTNSSRAKPYDWVMPNDLLDDQHISMVVGSNNFANGLVFDSRVYSPISDVSPVQSSDSGASNMQHMGVFKDFEINTGPVPTSTPTVLVPTSTPTSIPTPTQIPTRTPTPTVAPGTPTNTPHPPTSTPDPPTITPTTPPEPSSTPDPECPETGVTIEMPSNIFLPGYTCSTTVRVCNATGDYLYDHPLFVILDVAGSYFFAPDFSSYNYIERGYAPGETPIDILPVFTWPSGAGTFSGALWYAALTDPDITELFGEMDVLEFGWQEP